MVATIDGSLCVANTRRYVRSGRAHTILGRLGHGVREQNGFAVGLELVIVVVGVVIGFEVTAWGQTRADSAKAQVYPQSPPSWQSRSVRPCWIRSIVKTIGESLYHRGYHFRMGWARNQIRLSSAALRKQVEAHVER